MTTKFRTTRLVALGTALVVAAATAAQPAAAGERGDPGERARLGVGVQPVSQAIAGLAGLEDPAGVLINRVVAGSSADLAGLEPGDIILTFAGEDVDRVRELVRLVRSNEPGAMVSLEVWRDEARSTVDLSLGPVQRGRLGVVLQPVSEAIARAVGLDAQTGSMVSEVVEGSAAASAGLSAGDIILGFAGETVDDTRELIRFVRRSEVGQSVSLEVWRDGQRMTLEATIEAAPPRG